MSLYLGIDCGTSGVRAAAVDEQGHQIALARVALPGSADQDGRAIQYPDQWWRSLAGCLDLLAARLRDRGRRLAEVAALSVDGTSGTLLLTDSRLRPITPALMYNSTGFPAEVKKIAAAVPADSITRGESSALARLLFLQSLPEAASAAHVMHQADWIAAMLSGKGGISDENNALKTGYDLAAGEWPARWFEPLGVRMEKLPIVHPAGQETGTVQRSMCDRFGFSLQARVIAGTTDSIAAFIATGAAKVGDGVTSLGTTLVIKLLSDMSVTDARRGVYSHRIFGMWLAGGASNAGGEALLKFFSREQIELLSARIGPETDSGLHYYPLPKRGERFPVSDPALEPVTTPRPPDDVRFLHGLLEGLARVERSGYDALQELGAPQVSNIRSVGGGAANSALYRIRQRMLGCPVSVETAEAAVGSALIALKADRPGQSTGLQSG